MPQRVLVVDDDADIRNLVQELLRRAGYDALSAPDGREALRLVYSERPDLVVLDASMPVLDGWQTLERIRELSEVPVIMLTARATELDKVRGLKAGADDYVTKPFGQQELLARVEAQLRRGKPADDRAPVYSDALIEIDYAQRAVKAAGRDVQLTPTEFKLLAAFVSHPNQVLSREQLLRLVWGDESGSSRDQVKLYVGYLRRKLGPEAGNVLQTVRGFGYRYTARPARGPAA
jgi:DNA-binding response OmpR family regulator